MGYTETKGENCLFFGKIRPSEGRARIAIQASVTTFLKIRSYISTLETSARFARRFRGKPPVNAETIGGFKKVRIDAMRRCNTGNLFDDLPVAAIMQVQPGQHTGVQHSSSDLFFFIRGKRDELDAPGFQLRIKRHEREIAMPDPGVANAGKNGVKGVFSGPLHAARIAIFTNRIKPPEHPLGPDHAAEPQQGIQPPAQRRDSGFKIGGIVYREMEYGVIEPDELFEQRMAYERSEILGPENVAENVFRFQRNRIGSAVSPVIDDFTLHPGVEKIMREKSGNIGPPGGGNV